MTRYSPLWQQANSYAAGLDRGLVSTIWPAGGVYLGAVSAVANTMNVQASPGTAVVPLQSGQGAVLCRWDANEVVTIPAAPPSGQSRIDLVVAQVRDNALDAGPNNDFIFTSVTGTAAASNPTTPATPANALVVATVLVPGAAANLNTATVTNRPGLSPRASVYRNAAWNTVGPAPTLFGFDGNEDNAAGLYSTGTVGFTCPLAGRYLVCLKYNVGGSAAGQYLQCQLWRNSAAAKLGPYMVMPSGLTMESALTHVLRCAAGDLLQSYYVCSTNGLVGGTGPGACWGTFDYIGP